MILQGWRRSIDKLAKCEISEASHLRMLIAALVMANWATLQMLFLYVAELVSAQRAIQMSVFTNGLIFVAYFAITNTPAIARNLKPIIGENE